ncbi:hypothetical protein ERJ70_05825 [Sediminibacillus dalangtanensis]|uniref:Uncharacterized protein n=1 Tax=Sediminibacillus dalangtanensis TaxID=2729421 RepID=A0ABX7VQR9_9BACI|nr:hypothetical protein [Sediminibacillus dalangtanensis]QTM98858.1 hypothetical protein ERJ70_05825 [Sediminibacillus dalangtanensis]
MTDKESHPEKEANAELSGMGLYGTTSTEEVAGYQATGNIENAGKPEKGFRKEAGHRGATASVNGEHQRGLEKPGD